MLPSHCPAPRIGEGRTLHFVYFIILKQDVKAIEYLPVLTSLFLACELFCSFVFVHFPHLFRGHPVYL